VKAREVRANRVCRRAVIASPFAARALRSDRDPIGVEARAVPP
jgi:hypothetical protein